MKHIPQDKMLIDGYNVINAWPELIAIKDNLEYARDKLVDTISGYGFFQNYRITLVFDAHGVKGSDGCQQVINDFVEVVYTREGETADSYIEKMVYDLMRRPDPGRVYVVTSDWAEQMVVLGAGAYRISARELRAYVAQAQKNMQEGFSEHVLNYRRQELQYRLNKDVAKRLDEIRRDGKKG